MNNPTHENLISILGGKFPEEVDWLALFELANRQGIAAYLWDKLEPRINDGTISMPKELMLKWGWTAIAYEKRYDKYEEVISKLAQFYAKHDIKLMLLKGYGLSLNYPVPKHRPCGDIDTYNFGEYKKADAVLEAETGIKVDNTHHHHTVFHVGGFMVENHYDFLTVHAHKSSSEINDYLKEIVEPCEKVILKQGGEVYLPSPQFNALFILSHSAAHFAANEINLRQILDWGYFVERYSPKINWQRFQEDCKKWGRIKFLDAMNEVCIDKLGFNPELFPVYESNLPLAQRVLEDTLHAEFAEEAPKSFIGILFWKYRRWRANRWKNEIVYPEKPLPTLFRQIWSHLLKPKSFRTV